MYWFDTVETIPEGVGFSYFGSTHITWLCVFVIFTVLLSVLYRCARKETRNVIRITIGSLIVLNEIFKWTMLFIGGNANVTYLPFHLCSINIFLIAVHMFKPSRLIDDFLYLICIPAAIVALLFPTWVSLPFGNFMHLHSFTVHILLAAYPIMLTVGGDIKPALKRFPCCLVILVGMAIVAYLVNILLDTNFMFLMYANEGNPLLLFEQMWGSHLLGFPVLLPLVFAIMYGIYYLFKTLCKK